VSGAEGLSAAESVSAAGPAPLPRASLADVLRRRAPLVGARFAAGLPRGLVSPVEARARLGLLYGDPAHAEATALTRRSLRRDLATLSGAALSRLWPAPGGRRVPRPYLVAARVDDLGFAGAVSALLAPPRPAAPPRARLVHFVHAHALDLAAADRDYRALLADADLVLPDGIGLRVAAAILGVSLRHNLNGTDLLPHLCRGAAERGIPLVLIGAAPGVADRCAARLCRRNPGLRVAFTAHGYLDGAAAAAAAAAVRDLGRALVLVGMGSPRQERFAREHLASAPEATVVTVGGLFDFHAGRLPRAPQVVRDLGMEWAYRLAQEPRRLGGRYLVGGPRFLLRVMWQRAVGPSAE
jgi:N-acetylglucosaminyldiphosphoundecaprenol N-acetyl-beta-D-mannosaminyltransferase